MIYNVPLALLSDYSSENVVVRSSDAKGLVKAVLGDHDGRIKAVQLLSPGKEAKDLRDLPPSVQVDLCLMEPRLDKGIASVCRRLVECRSVRLVVPVAPGFSTAVKDALQFGLRVKLILDQPDDALVEDLKKCFVFFTREPDVKEPVDLFSGLLGSFLTKRVESLWNIQEEHPSSHCYVTDSGELTLSKRLADAAHGPNLATFLADHKLNLFRGKEECCTCRFFTHCEGYFKLLREGYSCAAVKEFLTQVWGVATELRTDLSQAPDSSKAGL